VRGAGELGEAPCTTKPNNSFTFAKDPFREPFDNQINLTVFARAEQDPAFWKGVDSIQTYVSQHQLKEKVSSYGTVSGTPAVFLKPETKPGALGGTEITMYVYVKNDVYEIIFYDVPANVRSTFIASLKFAK
jgi:hypothetical protein